VAQFPVISRDVARMANMVRYNTGLPCRKGHQSPRYTASGQCTICCENRRRGTNRGNLHSYKFDIHPDDVPAVQALVDALGLARKLGQ